MQQPEFKTIYRAVASLPNGWSIVALFVEGDVPRRPILEDVEQRLRIHLEQIDDPFQRDQVLNMLEAMRCPYTSSAHSSRPDWWAWSFEFAGSNVGQIEVGLCQGSIL